MKTKILAVGLVLIALLAMFAATASAALPTPSVSQRVGTSHEQLNAIGYVDIGIRYLFAVYQINQPSGYNINEYVSFFVDVNKDGQFSDLELVNPGLGSCNQFVADPTGATPINPVQYACFNEIQPAMVLNPGNNYRVRGVLNADGFGPIVDPRQNPVYGNVIHRLIHIP